MASKKSLVRRTLYAGKKLRLVGELFRLPSGKKHLHETIHHPGSCAVVPLLSRNRIVLIHQKRPSIRKWLWEIPAGTLERGENPRRCAARELVEETGYRAKQLKKIAAFYTSPGFCTEIMHLYVARNLSSVTQKLEEDEAIQPRIFPIQKALQMVKKGAIRDAKTIVGLCFIYNSL